jgi:parvulin-like peptidyl-prolyl isomerase
MRRYPQVLFLCLLVWGRAAAAGQGFLIDKVVAVVNDEVIPLSELQMDGQPLMQRIREELEGDAQANQMRITQRQILDDMILRRLQLQEAKKLGIVSEEMVVRRLLARKVRTSIVVSEEEITEYYQAHMDEFDRSPSVRLRHVLIRLPEDPSPQGVMQAQSRAAEALRRLKSGATFQEVAAEYSDGAAAKEGGDLGVIRRGELDPALEQVAFSLEPGKVSDVIETAAGLNIIRVEERTTGDVPIAKVRDQVRQDLFAEKMQQQTNAYFAELKEKAYIDIRLTQ